MRIAEDVRAVWDRSWNTPWAWVLLVTYNVSIGLALLLGGEERISSPSFSVIRQVGYQVTGGAFLLGGIALALSALLHRRAMVLVAMVLALAHLLLAAGFLGAVLHEPVDVSSSMIRPAWLGIPTYLFVSVVHFINAFVYGRRGPLGERGGSA